MVSLKCRILLRKNADGTFRLDYAPVGKWMIYGYQKEQNKDIIVKSDINNDFKGA
jgi:hypothetical protein